MEEAFGLVVAEALARDVKIFAAKTGGIVDICDGVESAELFAPDDWQGLGLAIADWIGRGYPRPVGISQLMRDRYHPSRIAAMHRAIYSEVAAYE
jgi:glycosyltransferase involved in cell wall biosynthesis